MGRKDRPRQRGRGAPAAGRRPHPRWATAGEFVGAFFAALGVRRVGRAPTSPPLERICADLHRINNEIAKVLADPSIPARYHRLVAASWAYDAALRDACNAIGVEPPPHVPLDQYARLATEAELSARGMRW